MWWECSECGNRLEAADRPETCPECDVEGAVFVRLGSCARGGPETRSLAELWLRAGLRGDLPGRALDAT